MGWSTATIPDLTGSVTVVTGANSGIGFETARVLAQKGATVVLACRNADKGHEAVAKIQRDNPQGEPSFLALDLSDLGAIATFAAEFRRAHARLDLLINNAGVMMPPLSRTRDGFELQFGTNHLGHFALTARLLELLLATPDARVVNVSSLAHRGGHIDFSNLNAEKRYRKMGAYAQSKLANLLFTFELQRRLDAAGHRVVVAAAHPGWTATNLQQTTPSFRMLNPVLAQTPLAGALPTLYAATAADVKPGDYYGPNGWFEMRGAPKRAAVSGRARDRETARRLWEVSEQLTGTPFEIPPAAAERG